VRGVFTPRGGIQTTVEASFPRTPAGAGPFPSATFSARGSRRRSPAPSTRRSESGGRPKAR
jgi:hypothetical protein